MSDNNNNNISKKDSNSPILSILPKEWREPLIIISKVKKYESVDSYILEMIRDWLEMFIDTRDELREDFKIYMKGLDGLEDLSAAEEDDDEESKSDKNYVNVRIDADSCRKTCKGRRKEETKTTATGKGRESNY